jgi:hypothetical protein
MILIARCRRCHTAIASLLSMLIVPKPALQTHVICQIEDDIGQYDLEAEYVLTM